MLKTIMIGEILEQHYILEHIFRSWT